MFIRNDELRLSIFERSSSVLLGLYHVKLRSFTIASTFVSSKLRDEVKNKLPKLAIIFSLIKTNSLRYNELYKKDLTQSKGNRIGKLGRLFFTSSLNQSLLKTLSHGSN
jgi:ABC-type molybdenum transport system ATPase subunit/photorepair protein PhrA